MSWSGSWASRRSRTSCVPGSRRHAAQNEVRDAWKKIRDQEIQRAFKESCAQETLALMAEYRALGCEADSGRVTEIRDLDSIASLSFHMADLARDLTKHRSKVI